MISLLTALAAACGSRGEPSFSFYDFERDLEAAPETGELDCAEHLPCEGLFGAARFNVRGEPALTAEDVADARAVTDPSTGAPAVLISLTAEGRRAFADLTRELARRGAREGVPQHVAVVFDGVVLSAPRVDFAASPDGLSAEMGVQLSAPTRERAREIAAELAR